jgi:hypothetical protein
MPFPLACPPPRAAWNCGCLRSAEGEVSLPPTDADEWMVQRAAARDIPGGVAIAHGSVRKCQLFIGPGLDD